MEKTLFYIKIIFLDFQKPFTFMLSLIWILHDFLCFLAYSGNSEGVLNKLFDCNTVLFGSSLEKKETFQRFLS